MRNALKPAQQLTTTHFEVLTIIHNFCSRWGITGVVWRLDGFVTRTVGARQRTITKQDTLWSRRCGERKHAEWLNRWKYLAVMHVDTFETTFCEPPQMNHVYNKKKKKNHTCALHPFRWATHINLNKFARMWACACDNLGREQTKPTHIVRCHTHVYTHMYIQWVSALVRLHT